MFWKKPPKSTPSEGAPQTREELIAQAKADLRAARADLGEDTIAQMKALALAQQEMQKQASSAPPNPLPRPEELKPAERARELIKHMDKAKLADYIRTTSREED